MQMLMIAIPLFLSLQSLCCYRREIRYPLAACFPARCPDFNSQVHFFFFSLLCALCQGGNSHTFQLICSGWRKQISHISSLSSAKGISPWSGEHGLLSLPSKTFASMFQRTFVYSSYSGCAMGSSGSQCWISLTLCIPFAHVVNLYCVPNIREFWSTFFSPRKLLLLWDKGGHRRMS